MRYLAMIRVTAAIALAATTLLSGQPVDSDAPASTDTPASQPSLPPARPTETAIDTEPDDPDWEEVRQFLLENSPHRLAAAEAHRQSKELWRNWKAQMTDRYAELKQIEAWSPNSYQRRLRLLGMEDEVYRLGRLCATTRPADRDEIRRQMDAKMAEVFDESMLERQGRLRRLKDAIATEEDALAMDAQGRDRIIKDRVEHIIAQPWARVLPPPVAADTPQPATAPATRPATVPIDRDAPRSADPRQ